MYIHRRLQGRGGASVVAAKICPFDSSIASTTLVQSQPTLVNVFIRPGYINQLTPTNMFNVDYKSEIETSLTPPGILYCKLKATTNSQSITSCEIIIDTTPVNPVQNLAPGSAPLAFEVLFAVITAKTTTDFKLCQLARGNIIAVPKQAFLVGKLPAGAGAEPFDRYWTWVIAQDCA